MQLALSALAALGLGGTATGAAGLAAGGTAAAAGGASVLGLLQGLGTVVSILGTLGQGAAAASESRQEATQAELQAGQEEVASQQRARQMKAELLRVLGENDVTFAAAGIDTTQGIAATSRQMNQREATAQLSIDRNDSDFRRALLAARASGLRARAGSQVGGALLRAFGQGLDFGISSFQRGG